MAKTAFIFWCVILVICGRADCFSQDAGISRQRAALIAEYSRQVGVREKTGHNDGDSVEKYLASVGLMQGAPWCAAFEKYCFVVVGISVPRINGAASSTLNRDHVLFMTGHWYGEPLPGDVGVLYYKSLGRIAHTFFFNGWANRSMGSVHTVEGNTAGNGTRDGDGVYRRIRQAGTVYAFSRWVN